MSAVTSSINLYAAPAEVVPPTVLAAEVRRRAAIPFVLSLHTNPGESRRFVQRRWRHDPKAAILAPANAPIQRVGLRHADCVTCVYRYSVRGARSAGATRAEVSVPAAPGVWRPLLDSTDAVWGGPRTEASGDQSSRGSLSGALEPWQVLVLARRGDS